MYGYLRIFVLQELRKRGMTGYDIMKSFESFTGTKMPSPGTVYPLLDGMLKRGLISVSDRSKKKLYSITKDGERVLQMLMAERKKALRSMMPILSAVYSQKEMVKVKRSLGIMSGTKGQLCRDFDVLHELRDSIMGFITSRAYRQKRQEFRHIMSDASKKLKGLMR